MTALVVDKHSKDGTLPLSVFVEALHRASQLYRDWSSCIPSKPHLYGPKGHKYRLPWLLPTSHSPYLDLSDSLVSDRVGATHDWSSVTVPAGLFSSEANAHLSHLQHALRADRARDGHCSLSLRSWAPHKSSR